MPFTPFPPLSSPVITPVSDQLARITGVTLGSGAFGTISLQEGAGELRLPDSMNWAPYGRFDDPNQVVDLVESVEVDWHFLGDPGLTYELSGRIGLAKAAGGSPTTFLITLTNFDTGEDFTAPMEIYVRFH